MSEVIVPRIEAVASELESLVRKLQLVAPTDYKAHQDLLSRIIQVSERGSQIPSPTPTPGQD
jgi:hypothetical protein